jgi:hypothetical protein
MQLIQRAQRGRERSEPSRVRYEDAERHQLGYEKRKGSKRIGRHIQFFQAEAGFESGRKSAEKIGRNI